MERGCRWIFYENPAAVAGFGGRGKEEGE